MFRYLLFFTVVLLSVAGCEDKSNNLSIKDANSNDKQSSGNDFLDPDPNKKGQTALSEITEIALVAVSYTEDKAVLKVSVQGADPLDTVNVYTSPSCNGSIGNALADDTGVEITLSPLPEGKYNFYAKRRRGADNVESACSTAFLPYTISFPKLTITGLSNDETLTRTKTWQWNCAQNGAPTTCQYRTTINQQSGHTFSDEAFQNTSSVTQSEGTGTYYLHIQARKQSEPPLTSVTYSYSVKLDNMPPATPSKLTLIEPTSALGEDATPTIRIDGVATGDTVRLYTNNQCSLTSAVVSAQATGSTISLTTKVLNNGNYAFYANSTDSLGNTSLCSTESVSYTLDTTTLSVTGLTNDDVITRSKTWQWGCSNTAGCTYRHAITGQSSHTFGSSKPYTTNTTIAQTNINGRYYLHVQAKNNNGKVSNIRTVYALFDNTPPNAPTGLRLVNPQESPSPELRPTLSVEGLVAGDTIKLFSDSACNTQPIAEAQATSTTAQLRLTANLPSYTKYNFYANSTDSPGNISNCSSAFVEYVTEEQLPIISGKLFITDSPSVLYSPIIDWSSLQLDALGNGVQDKIDIQIKKADGTVVLDWQEIPEGVNKSTYRVRNGIDGFTLSIEDDVSYFASLRVTDTLGYAAKITSDVWKIAVPLTDMSTWLDAGSINFFAIATAPLMHSDGHKITSRDFWGDKTGLNNNFVPAQTPPSGGSEALTYHHYGINGRPTVRILGSGYKSYGERDITTEAYTVYVVARKLVSDYQGRVIDSNEGNSLIGWWGKNTNTWNAQSDQSMPASPHVSETVDPGVTDHQPTKLKLIGAIRQNNGDAELRDEQGHVHTALNTQSMIGNRWHIGTGNYSQKTNEYSHIEIAEFLQWDRALSVSEQTEVENYLKEKYFQLESVITQDPPQNTSCYNIKSIDPSITENGIYTIRVNGTNINVYCNMEHDGGGWTLIGRGKRGWQFSDHINEHGQEPNMVHRYVGTERAFIPAFYSSTIVDAIAGKQISTLYKGVWLRRAKKIDGSEFQNVVWKFDGLNKWSWHFDVLPSGLSLKNTSTIDGQPFDFNSNKSTRDTYINGHSPQGFLRLHTKAIPSNDYLAGFSYGLDLTEKSTNTSDYIYGTNEAGSSGIPYTEVYIRN